MIEWCMNVHDKETPDARHRRKGHEEELALCNEAVESGDHDLISDAAWIILCNEAVTRGRKSSLSSNA